MTLLDHRAEISELSTLRDVLRYAVSAFRGARLHHGHGATNALDEAAFLILESLNLPVDDFNAFADARLTVREKKLLAERIAMRIEKRVPAAYITGHTYLHGFSFRSDPRAIVPRSFIADLLFSPLFDGSETGEALVEDPASVMRVMDLCTGGGSLAILAAHAFPNAEISAVDLSAEALSLAAENVADYGMQDRITLHRGDLFSPLKGRRFDLILTNPPYVDQATMDLLPEEFRHEPVMSLAGGDDGFDIVRRILKDAPRHLESGGGLLCEVGLDRDVLDAEYPHLPFTWLDTEDSAGEVFWLRTEDLKG
ncbi:MAG: 50S ribosomal protein L3 N(5)-glutamine methyltransferase [Rhizobiales bacterium]|nr:50S ribosomal protein L3 N(5)-glutamine methyltransferase [Hyphomicrobiales bacterium]